jgi:hypothetical protein
VGHGAPVRLRSILMAAILYWGAADNRVGEHDAE